MNTISQLSLVVSMSQPMLWAGQILLELTRRLCLDVKRRFERRRAQRELQRLMTR